MNVIETAKIIAASTQLRPVIPLPPPLPCTETLTGAFVPAQRYPAVTRTPLPPSTPSSLRAPLGPDRRTVSPPGPRGASRACPRATHPTQPVDGYSGFGWVRRYAGRQDP